MIPFFDLMIIGGIVLVIFIVLASIYQKTLVESEAETKTEEEIYTIENAISIVNEEMIRMQQVSVIDLGLKKSDALKYQTQKHQIRKAANMCSVGDLDAKLIIKGYYTQILLNNPKFHVDESNVDYFIPFEKVRELSQRDKFEIILFWYKKSFGYRALLELIKDYELDEYRGEDEEWGYYMDNDDLNFIFLDVANLFEPGATVGEVERISRTPILSLGFSDKLSLVVDRVYANSKGHGVVDEIRDMVIDGVSAGVSGITPEMFSNGVVQDDKQEVHYSFDSVWIMYSGKSIQLRPLGFGSELELERVCKNIYKYNSPGMLSEARGGINSSMKDGSRLTISRSQFSESWAFFVRKSGTSSNLTLYDTIVDKNYQSVIDCIDCTIKGCSNIIITGEPGSGKTTALRLFLLKVNNTFTVRIQETISELYLRTLSMYKNILSFKETTTKTGQDGVNFNKKTDTSVMVVGEIASAEVATLFIQISQVGANQAFGTHHGKTAEDTVVAITGNFLSTQGNSDAKSTELMVAKSINFIYHYEGTTKGVRYLERITEIIPNSAIKLPENKEEAEFQLILKQLNERQFTTRDIFVREENKETGEAEFIFKNKIAWTHAEKIRKNLTIEQLEKYSYLLEGSAEG